jgi:hypothetical protein
MRTKSNRATGESSVRQVGALVQQLERLKASFDRSSTNLKQALLRKLCSAEMIDAATLTAYHDILCFLRAYPDNAQIARITEGELQSFGSRVGKYRQQSRDRRGKRLVNSGITNTTVVHPFSYEAARLLMTWHPGMLEFDWESIDEDEIDGILDILPLLVSWQENDTLDNDPTLEIRQWLVAARGQKTGSDLETLVKLLDASGLPREVQRHFFDNLDFPIVWLLSDSQASRTLKRVPSKKIHYQTGPLRGRSADLRAELATPATPLHLLSLRKGEELVRTINEVLAVRYRELFPITFANPAEVYVNEPGRGVQIFIYGSRPEARLPLESNFGAMLVRNGLPVGYGVGATLFERVEIAINIFPAFRGGESAYIIEQFFRLLYHHFGSRVFLVRSRQMGEGDDEPLQSGAFWFYYKLGFRAVKSRIRELADKEYELVHSDPAYRSPLRTLRRLAKSDVFFHVDPFGMDSYEELSIVNLGYVVTKYFADKFNGNRQRGTRQSASELARILEMPAWKRWSKDERWAFEHLAPLIINIPDLAGWTAKELKALVRVIRSKGAVRERDFVLLSNRHRRFKTALEELAGSYDFSEPMVGTD